MTTKIEHDPRKVNKASLLFLIKKEHRALVKLAHRQQYVTPRAVPLPRNLVRVSQATSFDPRDWKHWYHNNTDYIRKGPQPKIGDSLHD